MRAGRNQRAFRVTAAAFALGLLVGCRVPGASFGTEPLQLRFSAATRQAIDAEAIIEERHRSTTPQSEPMRQSLSEPIVLAAYEQDEEAK